jgi:hypothetical protein
MPHVCPYCYVDFKSPTLLAKHKQRLGACVSWDKLDTLIRDARTDMLKAKNKVHEFDELQSKINTLRVIIQNKDDVLTNIKLQNAQRDTQIESLSRKLVQTGSMLCDFRNKIFQSDAQIITLYEELRSKDSIIRDLRDNSNSCQQPVCWNFIHITCDDLSKNTRTSIKQKLRFIQDSKEIRAFLENKKYSIKELKYDLVDKALFISLIKADDTCEICFVNKKTSVSACKTCKEINICDSCEKMQKQRFGRCAFCNVDY